MTNKKAKFPRALLSLLLAAVMAAGFCIPAAAAPEDGGEKDYSGELIAFQASELGYNYGTDELDFAWVTIDPATVYYDHTVPYPADADYKGIEVIEQMGFSSYNPPYISAAVGIDGYVFFTYDEITDPGYTLYRGEIGSTKDAVPMVEMGSIDSNGFKVMEEILDMDYSGTDKRIYAIDDGSGNAIWSIDPLTGEVELAARVFVDGSNPFANLVNIAIDTDGETFYGTWTDADEVAGTREVKLERWTLKDAEMGSDGYRIVNSTTVGVLKLDEPKHNEIDNLVHDGAGSLCFVGDELYMASSEHERSTITSTLNRLYKVDKDSGRVEYANENNEKGAALFFAATAMFQMKDPGLLAPTQTVSSFALDRSELSLHTGGKARLGYKLSPWTLTDQTVKWESSNEDAVTVDQDGNVTAVGIGEAVIKATPTLAPDKAQTCAVSVVPLPEMHITAAGYKQEEGGWGDFDANDPGAFEVEEKTEKKYLGGGYIGNHKLLVQDGENAYIVDADTFETEKLGAVGYTFSDAVESPKLATEGLDGKTYPGLFLGKKEQYWGDASYLFCLDRDNLSPEEGYRFYGETYDDPGEHVLAAIAYAGKTTYVSEDYWGNTYEYPNSDLYYAVTEDGALYEIALYDTEDDLGERYLGTLPDVSLENGSDGDGSAFASMTMDVGTGYLVLTYGTSEGGTTVWAIDPKRAETVYTLKGEELGCFTAIYDYDRAHDIAVRLGVSETELLEDDTYTPEVQVILFKDDDRVTWASSDTDVAEVDPETGVITGTGEGSAVITATTVEAGKDGEKASASMTVNVTGRLRPYTNVQVSGQLDDGRWVTMPLRDVTEIEEIGTSQPLYGGGMHEGLIYGNDKPLDGGASDLFTLDPERDFEKTSWQSAPNWDQIGGYFGLVDATTAPGMDVVIGDLEATAFGYPMFIAYDSGTINSSGFRPGRGILLLRDIEVFSAYGLAYFEDVPEAGAVAYDRVAMTAEMVEYPEDNMSSLCEVFYVTDGVSLYTTAWIPAAAEDDYGNVGLSYNIVTTKVGDLDRVFEDNTALSAQMADLDLDGLNDGVVVAYSGDGAGRLFYIDLAKIKDGVCHVEYLGAVKGAARVTALYPAPTGEFPETPVTPVTPPPSVPSGPSQPGTSQETVTNPDGSRTTTTTNSDGTVTATTTTAEGVVGTEERDGEGVVTSAVVIIPEGAGGEGVVTAPIEVAAAGESSGAPEIVIRNESGGEVTVEIPVTKAGPGTVAVVVREDGTEEVVRDCVIGEKGVVLRVEEDVTIKVVDNTRTFVDVEPVHHWATDAVEFVAARGLFNGTGENRFTPGGDMTRGMVVTVLYRLANEPESGGESFGDVASGAYYSDAVAWAQSRGIVTGYSDSEFAPGDSVTRQQLVTILYRYAKEMGCVTGSAGSLEGYADAGEVSGWAAEAMSWAVETGLIEGVDGTRLAPTGNATRAAVATMIMRFCEKVIK